MILKPIKDQKIDDIVNKNKDYEMKLTSDQVLKEFEARKKTKVVEEKDIAKPNMFKKLIPYIGIGATCLATCAVVLTFVNRNHETIKIENISNNKSVLTSNEIDKALAKELLLFNFNYDSENDVATKTLKKALDVKYQDTTFTDSLDAILKNIANGFEKVSQIFLNGLFDFNEMKGEHKTLTKPKIINGESFDEVISYRYALVINYKYYYSSNSDTGYVAIPNGLFKEDYYKTTIEEVTENGESYIKTTLSKNESHFVINNKGSKVADDNDFNYFTFNSNESLENFNPLEQYKVHMDKEGKNSSFVLQNKVDYKIEYSKISNSIIDLIMCTFDVDYFDLINNFAKTFDNVKLTSLGGSTNEYKIGDHIIKI